MPKSIRKSDSKKPCCQTGNKICGKKKSQIQFQAAFRSAHRASKSTTASKSTAVRGSTTTRKIITAPNVQRGEKSWIYTDVVRDHFFNPRNLLSPEEEANYNADGVGIVGSPACGDVMKVWIKIKPKNVGENARIVECKWQTFGCGSAIASTSMMSQMVTENGGMKIKDAMKLTAMDINKRLGGLPAIKLHCSILGDQALKKAIKDYLRKT